MPQSFMQGWLDSTCGLYSIVNADKLVNKTSFEDSQELFNKIIHYLSKKRILKDILIGGTYHKNIVDIMNNVVSDRLSYKTGKNGYSKLDQWWQNAYDFINGDYNRSIIISIGGKINHFSVIQSMTEKEMLLADSSWMVKLRKSQCKFIGYTRTDKYILYPNQCFFLEKP